MWLHPHCLINKVLLIEHFSTIPQFFELRDVTRNVAYVFFRSRWASPLCLNLIVVTELSQLYIFKYIIIKISHIYDFLEYYLAKFYLQSYSIYI